MSTLKVDTIQAKSATTVSVPSGQTLSIAGTLDASSGSVKIPAAGVGPTGYGSSASPITYTVKVIAKTAAHPYYGTGSSSGYTINDIEGGTLQLTGADTGATYYHKFDQADSSNSGHPLLFYLDAAKTTAYTTNVTATGTPGSAGAYTTIQVDEYTPNILYYQCSSHAHMGNYVTVVSNKFNTNGVALKLPTADGTADQHLKTDGSGQLGWSTPPAAATNTPSWSAYNSAAQSCTANTETVATLDSENWDTDSAFASNKFTVPAGEGGKYSISYGTKFVAINASLNVRLYLRINGTNSDYTVIGSADPDANDHYVGSNVILNLAAADYVELIAYIATATDNIQYAHMSGFKLAGV